MKAILPLTKTLIAALEADGLLDTYMGGSALAFAYGVPETQTMPYLTIQIITSLDWSAQDFDGDEIVFRVAAHFERGKAASDNGVTDVGKACERIRDILAHRDGFKLDESPSEGETLSLDLLTGPTRKSTATDLQLVQCRYETGNIILGLNDESGTGGGRASITGPQSISGVLTFRAFIGPAN
tara:strand:+ start:1913 stop:2461 length:549 start_codon:yes stop_codon:yes gene_type:complete